jgi:GPH family glycoside/pentoside/hexuronide:cation symporter
MIGNMIPGLAGPVIVGMFGDRETIGYTIAGVSCAIIGFVVCFLHYYFTEERTSVGAETKADDIKFSDILEVVKKNRPFVALCIHGVCICLMQYAAQTLGMYMYSAVYHDVTYQSISSALSSPFMIGSMIAVPFLCKKIGLEKLIRICLLSGGAICGCLFVMHMIMDVHPLVHGVVLGIGSGLSMVSIQMQWGLVGEAIDYNEYVTGKRTEGSIYGTFNLSRRLGQTIGQGFALYGLAWIGYEGTAAVQSAGTIIGLKALCVLVPAVFILGSWAAFKFVWNITPEVRAEMAAKKAAQKAIEK